jgi:hypothetical protein
MTKTAKIIIIALSIILIACIVILIIVLNGPKDDSLIQPTQSPTPSATVAPKQITITVDKIGVHDNREDVIRGTDGEVYVYIVASNGINTDKMRLPAPDGSYYKLAKEESISVGVKYTVTVMPDDNFELTLIGYENDGEGFEQRVYTALETAAEMQLAGAAGILLDLFDVQLSGIIGGFLGEQDDYLGGYNRKWTATNNWGADTYTDIVCVDENGTPCLRLWFTIKVQ